jgi:hypothetical protein
MHLKTFEEKAPRSSCIESHDELNYAQLVLVQFIPDSCLVRLLAQLIGCTFRLPTQNYRNRNIKLLDQARLKIITFSIFRAITKSVQDMTEFESSIRLT